MNLINLFKLGQKYLTICPKDKELSYSFPEINIIRYTKLAIKYMPPAVAFLCAWQYYLHVNLALTIITVIFALSLPIQGFLWLGKRANTPIPLTLLTWYNQANQKLIEKKIFSAKKSSETAINFMAFMNLYNLTKKHLTDDEYLDILAENDQSK